MITDKDISIILPCHNEEKNLGSLLGKIKSIHPYAEILVVNDGCTDQSAQGGRSADGQRHAEQQGDKKAQYAADGIDDEVAIRAVYLGDQRADLV